MCYVENDTNNIFPPGRVPDYSCISHPANHYYNNTIQYEYK